MKKDKTHGVGILDRTKNIGKCYNITNINHFSKLDNDPTKNPSNKLQRTLQRPWGKISESEYKDSYPTGSRLGQFSGQAKVYKL